MENLQLEQLASLDDLTRCFLVPAIVYFNGTREDAREATRVTAEATLLDAFFWLDLGARLRIYSPQQTQIILSTYGHVLPDPKQLFSGPFDFLYNQFFIQQFYASLSGKTTAPVNYPQTDAFQLGMVFQLFMRQAANLALNPLTREFLGALNFYSPELFEGLMAADIVAEDAIAALGDSASEAIPLKARIVAAYFQTLQYMDGSVLMLGNHQRPESIDPGQWAMFRMEVFEVAHWRLAFRTNARVSVRFKLLTQNLEKALQSEAITLGMKLEAGGLNAVTDGLIAAWEGLALPVHGQAAG